MQWCFFSFHVLMPRALRFFLRCCRHFQSAMVDQPQQFEPLYRFVDRVIEHRYSQSANRESLLSQSATQPQHLRRAYVLSPPTSSSPSLSPSLGTNSPHARVSTPTFRPINESAVDSIPTFSMQQFLARSGTPDSEQTHMPAVQVSPFAICHSL